VIHIVVGAHRGLVVSGDSPDELIAMPKVPKNAPMPAPGASKLVSTPVLLRTKP